MHLSLTVLYYCRTAESFLLNCTKTMPSKLNIKITENGRIRSFALLATDVAMLVLGTFASFAVYRYCGGIYELFILFKAWPLIVLMVLFNVSGRLYCGNLIYPGLTINPAEELRRIVLSCLGSFLAFFAILSISRGSEMFSRVALTLSAVSSTVLVLLGRMVLRYFLWKLDIGSIPAVISGDSALAANVAAKISGDNYCILTLKASFCQEQISEDIPNYSLEDLEEITDRKGIYYLIYCNSANSYSDEVEHYLAAFRHVLVVNGTERFPVLWSYPVSFYRYFSFEISNRFRRSGILYQKQLLEIIFSVLGMIIAFLPGVVLAALVKLSSPGPVFYRANRLGLNGKPIKVLKLRTMYEDADEKLEQLLADNPELYEEWEKSYKLENDPRVTPIGKFLRKTSLDEIPQFWNVIKGEMALIGPRPIVRNEVAFYGDDYKILASVKPGITGLWQVSGRSNLSYDERVALDVFYVNNWSLWLDLYIFVATFNAVLFRRGAK